MYSKITRAIQIIVHPSYSHQESRPQQNYYVWQYEIKIKNSGKTKVQLLNRFWRIKNALAATNEVFGAGVVGQQPIILPDSEYSYKSFTVLNTSSGSMTGSYQMLTAAGELFHAEIPEFLLTFPCRLVNES